MRQNYPMDVSVCQQDLIAQGNLRASQLGSRGLQGRGHEVAAAAAVVDQVRVLRGHWVALMARCIVTRAALHRREAKWKFRRYRPSSIWSCIGLPLCSLMAEIIQRPDTRAPSMSMQLCKAAAGGP